MTMSLLPLVAYGFYLLSRRLRKGWLIAVAVFLFFAIPLRINYFILSDFSNAPIPNADKEQYVNGWPAGGGVKESVVLFEELSKEGPIVIATQGTFGLMPYAYEIYLVDKPNITIKGYWPIEDTPPEELVEMSETGRVYTVFYQPCPSCPSNGKPPETWPVELVREYEKGLGNTLAVYKFKTE